MVEHAAHNGTSGSSNLPLLISRHRGVSIEAPPLVGATQRGPL